MRGIVQKLHPSLQSGQRLTLTGSKTVLHSYQGAWDGGCGLHCLAMACAMLGRISDPARVSWRRRGPEAEFWERACPYYLSGITLSELASVAWELNWGLRPIVVEGAHRTVLAFCERELSRGHPVIVSWRPVHGSQFHAVLAIGVEGRVNGRAFEPHTLLLLDPGENEPWLATCNARLTYAGPTAPRGRGHATYVTGGGPQSVTVGGAVSIHLAGSGTRPP